MDMNLTYCKVLLQITSCRCDDLLWNWVLSRGLRFWHRSRLSYSTSAARRTDIVVATTATAQWRWGGGRRRATGWAKRALLLLLGLCCRRCPMILEMVVIISPRREVSRLFLTSVNHSRTGGGSIYYLILRNWWRLQNYIVQQWVK